MLQRDRLLWVFAWALPALYFLFPTWMVLSNVMLLLVLVSFALTMSTNDLAARYWCWPARWLLAMFGMVLVGCLYTTAPWDWMALHLGKYAKFVYAVVLMLLLAQYPVLQKRALTTFVVAMLFILASTWLNVWFVLPWSVTKLPGWGVTHHVFGDYITQNVMMSFFVVVALSKVKRPFIEASRWAWLLVAVLAAGSITHLSNGRTGLLVLLAGLISWLVVRFKPKQVLIAIPVVVVVTGIALSSSKVLSDRFLLGWNEFSNRDADVMTSIGHRFYNYQKTPQLIAENPIVGHGTAAYHVEICRFLDKPEWCTIFSWHPHNQFLFFATDHGLVGVLLYVALLASLYRVAWRSSHPQAKVMLTALTSILIVDGMFNTPLYSSIESHFFLYMMALLVAMGRQCCMDPAGKAQSTS
jgi:O-antigen ligase